MSEPVVEVLQAAGGALQAPGQVGAGLNAALLGLAGLAASGAALTLGGATEAPPAPVPAAAWAGADDPLLAALAGESADDKGALSVVIPGGGE